MMDVVNDPAIETVVYMIAAQCGKTACEFNIFGYFAHQDPSPILFVMPSEQTAEALSKERIATMIRDTPALTPLFGSPKSKDSGNTLLNKKFPGGFLALAGANAPSGLASRPARILIMDEIDRYPATAGTEGDPVSLAEARTTNFWNRKRIYSSTPLDKNLSRIEKLEENSDRRRYFVPCPHCGEFQQLEWERLKWPGPRTGAARHEPQNCYYVCVSGCEILEHEKPDMLRLGHWRKTNPGGGDGKTAGFQLSALYSPWKTWPEIISQWLKAFKYPQQCKTFVNTVLGRTYESTGQTVDHHQLSRNRILYDAEVPTGAMVLTAGLDVQADRVEMEVVGWGADEQSWSICYKIFRGNPAMPGGVWDEVKSELIRTFAHASGVTLRIASAYIDSGYHTRQVYKFVRPLQIRRIFASKGLSGSGVPVNRARAQSRSHAGRVQLRIVGIDAAKESLYERLNMKEIGPGFCHFPTAYTDADGNTIERREYDAEYFEQLTAEKLVSRMEGMTPVRKWEKKRERNEALDCRVLAIAALDDLQPNWPAIQRNFDAKVALAEQEKGSESSETSSKAPQKKTVPPRNINPIANALKARHVNDWRR
jgi:phage terminase large subunit GpA-like protein